MGHIKRLAAPKTWPINRKLSKWIYKPSPGPHRIENALPLGTILKEMLGLAKNTKEVNYILNNGLVKVNGKIRKDKKFPVGLMDVLSYKDKHYRILFNTKGLLTLHQINPDEAKILLKKVIGKTILKKGKLQINCFDGTNIITNENKIKVNDTLVFEDGKLKQKLSLEKGAIIYIMHGRQVGKVCTLEEIKTENPLLPPKLVLSHNKEKFETIKDYAFVIGKDKPLITLPNE
jgi:small subunit ribosomal protein S4e